MEYHTSSDSLDSWDITNDFNWLEAAFGRDLHDLAAALPYEVEQLSGFREMDFIAGNAINNQEATLGSVPEPLGSNKDRSTVDVAFGHRQNEAVSGDVELESAFGASPTAFTEHSSTAASAGGPIIVCYEPSDAPSGWKLKTLQCGIFKSDKLFNRRFELARHMTTHFPGQYPCMQPGCAFTGVRALKRADARQAQA
ncbi:hypothetical protein LTR27_012475 [Elasticomyces elasticus]|nr:hypothetical protein LTR27_012475 [Elasticomyces elasticus]